jgi:hypothetical protein
VGRAARAKRDRPQAATINRTEPVQLTETEFRILKAANVAVDQARIASAATNNVARALFNQVQAKYQFDGDVLWTLDEATCRLLPQPLAASDSSGAPPRA